MEPEKTNQKELFYLPVIDDDGLNIHSNEDCSKYSKNELLFYDKYEIIFKSVISH